MGNNSTVDTAGTYATLARVSWRPAGLHVCACSYQSRSKKLNLLDGSTYRDQDSVCSYVRTQVARRQAVSTYRRLLLPLFTLGVGHRILK
jgi:hypothetical protein